MPSSTFSLEVISLLNPEMGRVNTVYVSRDPNIPDPDLHFIVLKDVPFTYLKDNRINGSEISLSSSQRESLHSSIKTKLNASFISKNIIIPLKQIKISLEVLNAGLRQADASSLITLFIDTYNGYPFSLSQIFYFITEELTLKATVTFIEHDLKQTNNTNIGSKDTLSYTKTGQITCKTQVFFTSSSKRLELNLNPSSLINNNSPLLSPDFSFEDLGIGGLKTEFSTMFRRAFVQRVFDSSVIKKLGIPHVKGILLYGPPGTGKTLIARQIGSLLNAHPPKIVNGPEILNKYVGQSEENIRLLFNDAEKEFKSRGNKSLLHIIIFDELDAIFKTRSSGSSSTGISDQVVNQLLSKMDGVEALDNILVIGMTNRPDLIDSALLRPGRFEIHIEITLPSEEGRLEIFRIHTKEMRRNGFLEDNVDLKGLAKNTRNYTGAEVCAVVKCAASFALERKVHSSKEIEEKDLTENEIQNLSDKKSFFSRFSKNELGNNLSLEEENRVSKNKKLVGDENDIKITMDDFEKALNEIKPSFGCDEENLQKHIERFVNLKSHQKIMEKIKKFAERLKVSNNNKNEEEEPKDNNNNNKEYDMTEKDILILKEASERQKNKQTDLKSLSILLYGKPGTGKTTLAIKSSLLTKYPFIKLISPINIVGMGEGERIQYIKNVFEDAYRSEESIVILDDIPSLIDYVKIGPRFLNGVLQAIKVFIKNKSYKGMNRILVIGTSSDIGVLKDMGVIECFSDMEEVPLVTLSEYNCAVKGVVDNSVDDSDDRFMSIKNIVSEIEDNKTS